MDLRLGIVDGFWTEKAAKHALCVVTQMIPGKADELFARVSCELDRWDQDGRIGPWLPSRSRSARCPTLMAGWFFSW
jgi:hypothetical protein